MSDEMMKTTHRISFWNNVTLSQIYKLGPLPQHSEIHLYGLYALALSLGASGEKGTDFQDRDRFGLES